jgi:hypothetical protein
MLEPSKEAIEHLEPVPADVRSKIDKKSDGFTEVGSDIKKSLDISTMTGVGEGKRNDSLYRSACSLLRKYPREEAFQRLKDINNTYFPPLTASEFGTVFNSASDFVSSNPLPLKNDYRPHNEHAPSKQEVLPETTIFSEMSETQLTKVFEGERLSTGLSTIDHNFGWTPGSCLIIGHPGSGKSWLALWLARQFYARHNKKTMFWSLEMSSEGTKKRLLQSWSDLTKEATEYGQNTQQAEKMLKDDAIALQTWEDTSITLTPELFTEMSEKHIQEGTEVIIVDHFHHLPGVGGDNDSNQRFAGEWSRAFSSLCKNHPNIWLFVMAQPNASGSNETILRPDSIKGSKTPRQYFEYIITLSSEMVDLGDGDLSLKPESRKRILYVWKNRNGEQFFGERTELLPTGNFQTTETELIKQAREIFQ